MIDANDIDPIEIDGAELLNTSGHFSRTSSPIRLGVPLVAHVLWIAHTWLMECWESTPRIAFLSPEPLAAASHVH